MVPWCSVHAVARFPTVVDVARRGHDLLRASLRDLAEIVPDSDDNPPCLKAAPGAVVFPVSVVMTQRSPIWSVWSSTPVCSSQFQTANQRTQPKTLIRSGAD